MSKASTVVTCKWSQCIARPFHPASLSPSQSFPRTQTTICDASHQKNTCMYIIIITPIISSLSNNNLIQSLDPSVLLYPKPTFTFTSFKPNMTKNNPKTHKQIKADHNKNTRYCLQDAGGLFLKGGGQRGFFLVYRISPILPSYIGF